MIAGAKARIREGRWATVFGKLASNTVLYGILGIWTGLSIFALLWVIMTSLKTNMEFFQGVWALPKEGLQWQNYVTAWTRSHMGQYVVNTIVLSITTVIVIDLVAAMAAYILARFDFRGSRWVLLYFISGLAIPVQLILIPLYLFFYKVGLLDTQVGLAMVYIAVSLPFSVFVLTGFFKTLPTEIEDAAVIDGCSEYGLFWRVMLPLAMPGVVTISIFNFLDIWNEFLLALVLLASPERMTLGVGLYNLKVTQTYACDWTGMLAGLVIVLIPSLLVFFVLQGRIVKGLTMGALKG